MFGIVRWVDRWSHLFIPKEIAIHLQMKCKMRIVHCHSEDLTQGEAL